MADWAFIEEAKQRLQQKRQQDDPWKKRHDELYAKFTELENQHKQVLAVNAQLKQLLQEAIAAPVEPAKPTSFLLLRSSDLKRQFIFDSVIYMFRRNPLALEFKIPPLLEHRHVLRTTTAPFTDKDVWEYLRDEVVESTNGYGHDACPVIPDEGIFLRPAWLT